MVADIRMDADEFSLVLDARVVRNRVFAKILRYSRQMR